MEQEVAAGNITPKELTELDTFLNDTSEIKISDINDMDNPVILPSYTSDEYARFEKTLKVDELDKCDDETKLTTYMLLEDEDDRRKTNPDNMCAKKNINTFKPNPTINDNVLGMKQNPLRNRAKSSKAAMLKFTERLGLGAPIHIPLWHSGFNVTISPMTTEDIINLEFELIDNLKEFGKITNTLIYSSYNSIFARVIFNYFKQKIISTSVNLEDGFELEDIININDLYPISLLMATSMYPKGFNAIIPCKNTIINDDSGKPICSFKASKHIDLKLLLRPDISLLDIDQQNQMDKRTPNSVSVEDVLKYQERLANIQVKTITHDINGITTSFNLKVPTVSKYMLASNMFINRLKEKSNDIVLKNSSIDEDAAKNMLLEVFKLGTYTHYIDSIPIDDTTLDDTSDIIDVLDSISTDTILLNNILTDIKEFINSSHIAIVGIPTFKCPTCKTVQTDNEIIPLPVYDYFFILLHSKYSQTIKRITRQKKS